MTKQLPSAHTHNDRVRVALDPTTSVKGKIVEVAFTKGCVYYDVQTEYALLKRVESALVSAIEEPQTVEA
jgi:hypothetical protein